MGEKLPRILPKVATSISLLGSFARRKFTTWGRRLYFHSEGRRAEDFFARKIRRLRPGLNPLTWVPKASTLTPRPPKPLGSFSCQHQSTITLLSYLLQPPSMLRKLGDRQRLGNKTLQTPCDGGCSFFHSQCFKQSLT